MTELQMNNKIFFLSVVLICSCIPVLGMGQELQLNKQGEIILQDKAEESVYQTSSTEFAYHQGSVYYFSNDPVSITGYNLATAKQIFHAVFGGRGPYEMQSIYAIAAGDSGIYALSYTGKIIGFNHQRGAPVYERVLKLTRTKDLIVLAPETYWIATEAPDQATYLTAIAGQSSVPMSIGFEQTLENVLFSSFKRVEQH